MNYIRILRLTVVSALLSASVSAIASGGIVRFSGAIVEPTCSTGRVDGGQISIQCYKLSAFDVTLQRIGPNASSAGTTITLTRDGKALDVKEAQNYHIELQGNTQLGLSVKKPIAGGPLSPVILTINYL